MSGDGTNNLNCVYVGNLPYEVVSQELKDHMQSAGQVVKAEVLAARSGRSKGCGVVEYATAAEAQQAISTLNDTDLKGRLIFVREDRQTAKPQAARGGGNGAGANAVPANPCRLYVGNLAWGVRGKDLRDLFESHGNVVNAEVVMERRGKNGDRPERSRGYGFVEFATEAEALAATAALNGTTLQERDIQVREDRGPAKRS